MCTNNFGMAVHYTKYIYTLDVALYNYDFRKGLKMGTGF